MFRQILVPLDGSVFAEHAVPLAVALGEQTGATVRAPHAWSCRRSLNYFFCRHSWAGDPLDCPSFVNFIGPESCERISTV